MRYYLCTELVKECSANNTDSVLEFFVGHINLQLSCVTELQHNWWRHNFFVFELRNVKFLFS